MASDISLDAFARLTDALLGCRWGLTMWTSEEPERCTEGAVRRVMFHPPEGEPFLSQFCQRHLDVVLACTNPHEFTYEESRHAH